MRPLRPLLVGRSLSAFILCRRPPALSRLEALVCCIVVIPSSLFISRRLDLSLLDARFFDVVVVVVVIVNSLSLLFLLRPLLDDRGVCICNPSFSITRRLDLSRPPPPVDDRLLDLSLLKER